MTEPELLYTESDLRSFAARPRFLAAAHAYSLGLIPLGEAIVRAVEARPYYPKTLEILGYVRLLHEVAERISDGRIKVPDVLRSSLSATYDQKGHKDSEAVKLFSSRDFLMFEELRRPEVKKVVLDLFRRQFDEEDIGKVLADKRLLAAIDAYGRSLIDFRKLKESVFGDCNAHPFDLSFLAFQQLCFEVVRRVKLGTILIPNSFESEFSEIYHPTPNGES
ncbi:hypothetical protein JQ628_15515 [Bradyrhizobium lablabi]|uniref:hypothetical protein n=1 Tax=Bradyrhizobium lablabi TaxID=722472 RepID=UPI001BAC2CF5|nr:hypothetical protein [Bradyrhizobium lablabi]MBR1122935.1 hypothetical protein [Bradyrhizobium lablabi]